MQLYCQPVDCIRRLLAMFDAQHEPASCPSTRFGPALPYQMPLCNDQQDCQVIELEASSDLEIAQHPVQNPAHGMWHRGRKGAAQGGVVIRVLQANLTRSVAATAARRSGRVRRAAVPDAGTHVGSSLSDVPSTPLTAAAGVCMAASSECSPLCPVGVALHA